MTYKERMVGAGMLGLVSFPYDARRGADEGGPL